MALDLQLNPVSELQLCKVSGLDSAALIRPLMRKFQRRSKPKKDPDIQRRPVSTLPFVPKKKKKGEKREVI